MVLMYVPLPLDTMDWLMPAILVVATFVQFWAGRTIYAAAWAAARHGATNMNTLVALGTGVAYGYSAFVTLWPAAAEQWGLPLHVYFETVAGDHRAGPDGPLDGGPRQEADHRRDQGPGRPRAADRPRRSASGAEVDVPVDHVVVGDLVRVRPGEKVPVDGVVTEGRSRGRREHADRRARCR